MRPDPTNLLEIAGIETPLIGFYGVPELMKQWLDNQKPYIIEHKRPASSAPS